MDNVEIGEIVYCNLTIKHKGKTHILNEVVYKNSGGLYYRPTELKKLKIKDPVNVVSVSVIERLGFENKQNGHTKVKKSNENRNKITGAYE